MRGARIRKLAHKNSCPPKPHFLSGVWICCVICIKGMSFETSVHFVYMYIYMEDVFLSDSLWLSSLFICFCFSLEKLARIWCYRAIIMFIMVIGQYLVRTSTCLQGNTYSCKALKRKQLMMLKKQDGRKFTT